MNMLQKLSFSFVLLPLSKTFTFLFIGYLHLNVVAKWTKKEPKIKESLSLPLRRRQTEKSELKTEDVEDDDEEDHDKWETVLVEDK